MMISRGWLLAALLLVGGVARAQIPDEFTNLEVLPKDIGKRELIGVMRDFAGAVGGRCNFCHVGENAETLEGFDWASDEMETKRVARAMMRMTREINDRLLPTTGRETLTEVGCATCHSGIARPVPLGDVILAVVEEAGAEAAVARYRELREEYYGRAAYDFGPGTLNGVAETVARTSKDLDASLALLLVNVEFNPDATYTHFLLGEVYMRQENPDSALASYRRCLELEPDHRWAKQRIASLESGGPSD